MARIRGESLEAVRQERMALGDGYVWLAIAILRQAVIDASRHEQVALCGASRRAIRAAARDWLASDEARWLAARLELDLDVWRRYVRRVCGESNN